MSEHLFFSFIEIIQDWMLVKEGKTCNGDQTRIDHTVATIDECADRCAGVSSMFSIDTEFCKEGCNCTCHARATIDATCVLTTKYNNMLYRYMIEGTILQLQDLSTNAITFLIFSV